jgi:hypothetical protein
MTYVQAIFAAVVSVPLGAHIEGWCALKFIDIQHETRLVAGHHLGGLVRGVVFCVLAAVLGNNVLGVVSLGFGLGALACTVGVATIARLLRVKMSHGPSGPELRAAVDALPPDPPPCAACGLPLCDANQPIAPAEIVHKACLVALTSASETKPS